MAVLSTGLLEFPDFSGEVDGCLKARVKCMRGSRLRLTSPADRFSRRLLLLDDQCAPQSFLALQVVDESLAFEALGIPLDSFLFFLDGSQVA